HDMARGRHYRQAGLGETAFQSSSALLVAITLDLALLQMTDRGERAGGQRRRQRGCEDEPRRMAAQEIDERRRSRDVAGDRTEGLAESALDHGRAIHDPVALRDADAARA